MLEDELKKRGLRLRPRKVEVSNESAAQAGKVGFDDRGNAQFEWRDGELNGDGQQAERSRKQALAHPGLSLVEDEPLADAPIRANPKGARQGYNPYESGLLTRKNVRPRTDLHELSKWIEAKRKLTEKPPGDE